MGTMRFLIELNRAIIVAATKKRKKKE